MSFNNNKKTVQGITRIPGVSQLTFRDIDKSIIDLIDKRIDINVEVVDPKTNAITNSKVPCVFIGGERFAQSSTEGTYGEIRDERGKVMKPCVSISREDVDTSLSNYKGIPIPYVHRKVVNIIQSPVGQRKMLTPNTKGIIIGKNSNNVLAPPLEYILHDRPEYVTISYKISFWSSFQTQMNTMVQLFLQARDNPKFFYLRTDTGANIYVYIDENFSNQSNTSDFIDDERIIRTDINLSVSAPIRQNKSKSEDIELRRSPRTFNFKINESNASGPIRINEQNYKMFLSGKIDKINNYEIVDKNSLSLEDLNPYSRPRRTIESKVVNTLFSPARVYELMIADPVIHTVREKEYAQLNSKKRREASFIADSKDIYNRIFNGRYIIGNKVI